MHEGGESDSSILPEKRLNKVEAWTMRDEYGGPYTGTQVETPETAKGEPKGAYLLVGGGYHVWEEAIESLVNPR
jgi:hypothetical protein